MKGMGIILFVFSLAAQASAQEHRNIGSDTSMPGMNIGTQKDKGKMKHATSDTSMPMNGMGKRPMSDVPMTHAFSLNLPMQRNGSGTSWSPDASPMYGYMIHTAGWMLMFHGDIFPRYVHQDIAAKGTRGGEKGDAPDMLMAMGQRKIGTNGLFHFNVMLSTDPVIDGGYGYPLLFQTGESWKGIPLVDRQHPHDLFSELSVSYAHALSEKADLFVYLGYPGEPALGPVVFMHRASGQFIPDAPIAHHWEDATHITFGVATLGLRYGAFKLEGSSFTGREPDEDRYNFDTPHFDSWSGRLSYNPSENWALQVSRGFIKSPEQLRPDEDVHRTTASATYVKPWNYNNYVAATVLWGLNKTAGQDGSNAALLEATMKLARWAVYARYEWVQKSVEEMNLDETVYGPADRQFDLRTVTIGAAYDLFHIGHLTIAGGGQLTLDRPAQPLQAVYGSTPLGGELYLHIYPGKM